VQNALKISILTKKFNKGQNETQNYSMPVAYFDYGICKRKRASSEF
jgi:hypothetical protein